MKRIRLAGICFLSLFLCLSTMPWAGPKPPKKLCFSLEGELFGGAFVAKREGGAIPMKGGPLKFYGVHGFFSNPDRNGPLTGTGYMKGDQFHFILVGTYGIDGTPPAMEQIFIEGFYNVKTHTGTVYLNYTEYASTKSLKIVPLRCRNTSRPQ